MMPRLTPALFLRPWLRCASLALMLYALLLPTLQAQVTIEIAGVSGNAIPLALINSNQQADTQTALTVIANDLELSGVFAAQLSPLKAALPYEQWVGQSALYSAEITVTSADKKWQGNLVLRDLQQQKIVAAKNHSDSSLIALAHRIADELQLQLNQTPGINRTRIAYLGKQDGRYSMYMAYADGSEPKLLVNSKDPLLSPAWSPNGHELAYVSFERGRALIFIHDLVTNSRRTLTRFSGTNSAPAWSPDGTQLAFTSSHDGRSHVYLINADGTNPQALTSGRDIYTEARFEADGQSLFLTSDRGGSPQIYRLDLKSKKLDRITFEGSYNASPRVSPDGKYLAYISLRDKKFRLYLQDLNRKTEFQLSDSIGDEAVDFSPNSKNLILVTRNNGQRALLRVSLFGRPSRPIDTQIPPADVAWGPALP